MGAARPLLAGSKAAVAGLDSRQPVAGAAVAGQQNQGEVEKTGVKAVVGSLKTRTLQEVEGVGPP